MQCASGQIYRGSDLFFQYYVYTYSDPKDDQLRYVGKGNYFRAWSHLNVSSNRELDSLIKKRQREGFNVQPLIIKLFNNSEEELAYLLEKELIAFHGRKDLKLGPLFNYRDGGRTDSGKKTHRAIEFRGQNYPNLAACSRQFNVEVSNVYQRLKLGWTLAQALEIEEKVDAGGPRTITHAEVTYPSISNFSQRFNLNPDNVRYLIKRGFSTDQIIAGETQTPRSGIKIICAEDRYPSIQNFADSIQKSVKAVSYWLETGYTPEEIKGGHISNKSALYIDWKGMAITQGEFSELCNISFTTLIKYRNQGLNNQEIFEFGKRSLATKLGGKPVDTLGLTFASQTEFANHLGIRKNTLSKWLNKFLLTGEDCLKVVSLGNEIATRNYKSRKACLEHAVRIFRGSLPRLESEGRILTKADLQKITGLNQQTVNRRLNEGLTPDELVRWAKSHVSTKNYVDSFTVRGKKFFTHSAFAKSLGLENSSLVARYRAKGFSYEEIVEITRQANALVESGITSNQARRIITKKLDREKNGRALSGIAALYVELRKGGSDPKGAALEAGLTLSNIARLEKTYSGVISGEEKYWVPERVLLRR